MESWSLRIVPSEPYAFGSRSVSMGCGWLRKVLRTHPQLVLSRAYKAFPEGSKGCGRDVFSLGWRMNILPSDEYKGFWKNPKKINGQENVTLVLHNLYSLSSLWVYDYCPTSPNDVWMSVMRELIDYDSHIFHQARMWPKRAVKQIQDCSYEVRVIAGEGP